RSVNLFGLFPRTKAAQCPPEFTHMPAIRGGATRMDSVFGSKDHASEHGDKAANVGVTAVKSVTMPSESGKEDSWSHGQERTHSRNAHRRSDGEVCAGHEMTADAISDQE